MGERKPQVNIVIDQDQKNRWKEHVDDAGGEFRSLSHLIRRSVEKEISSDIGTEGDAITQELTHDLSELVNRFDNVESRLQDLDDRLAGVEREVREDPALKELANEVFSVLPTKAEMIEFEKSTIRAGATPDQPAATTGTVEAIATTLDEEEFRVAEALDKLQQETHQVGTVALEDEVQGWSELYGPDSETRYYKED